MLGKVRNLNGADRRAHSRNLLSDIVMRARAVECGLLMAIFGTVRKPLSVFQAKAGIHHRALSH